MWLQSQVCHQASKSTEERTQTRSKRRGPKVIYDGLVPNVLHIIWKTSGYLCSRRLKVAIALYLPSYKIEHSLSKDKEQKLLEINHQTIDRKLKPFRLSLKRRRFCTTRPWVLRMRYRIDGGLYLQCGRGRYNDWLDGVQGSLEQGTTRKCYRPLRILKELYLSPFLGLIVIMGEGFSITIFTVIVRCVLYIRGCNLPGADRIRRMTMLISSRRRLISWIMIGYLNYEATPDPSVAFSREAIGSFLLCFKYIFSKYHVCFKTLISGILLH